MRKDLVLVILLSVLTSIAFGQKKNNITPKQFIQNFKKDTLPICIDYSHDEQVYFGAIYHTDSVLIQDEDSSYYELQDVYEENKNYKKDTSQLIEKELVRQYLLPQTKFIYNLDEQTKDTLYSVPTNDYLINSDFYPLSLVLQTKNYYGVIYERIFLNSLPSSEKFFCTFSKKEGKFISRVLVASFVFSGTGISISGARFPWFPEENGCIEKNLEIKFSSGNNGIKKYKIQQDGKILEIK